MEENPEFEHLETPFRRVKITDPKEVQIRQLLKGPEKLVVGAETEPPHKLLQRPRTKVCRPVHKNAWQ